MAATSSAASGIVLETLTKDNYDNWSALVKNYLIGQGLWGVVKSDPGTGGGNSTVDPRIWEKKNAKALHAIQLACGSEITHIREVEKAKEAWNKLSALYSSKLKADPDIEQGLVDDSLLHNKSLHKYIESGVWNDAKSFINKTKQAIYSTSSLGRSVLHVAVIAGHEEIVKELVKIGGDKLVKIQDNRDYTALAVVAELTGNTKIAKYMIERRQRNVVNELLSMKPKDSEIPVLLAAAKGHKEMTRYLFTKTPLEELKDKNSHNGILLLTRCITAEIFDVALSLLQLIPNLPLAHKSDGVQPLYALARMPSAFPSGSGFGLLRQFIYNIFRRETPDRIVQKLQSNVVQEGKQCKTCFAGLIREIYNQKVTHILVHEILKCLYQRIGEFKESELEEASSYDAMLQAAKNGIVEFIDIMRKANPDLLWAIDKNKRGIFSHAILNRRIAIFQLIHDPTVNGRKEIVKCRADEFGNTLLHLAGYLGPSSDLDRRSGPALQMQREIQWFKAVEKIVHPKCKETKNKDGKKPREVFTESHRELVKAGEKWSKETAGSFALVATLITTIMFAAAFTVPGGNNQVTGVPLFLRDKMFTVFMIADAISLFTSSTSVLLFIGILTSRYAEKDFLRALPLKFLLGLVFLFVSVVSMILAFCASLAMILKGHQGVRIAAMSLGSIPVIVLVPSQFRLFLEIFNSTINKIE